MLAANSGPGLSGEPAPLPLRAQSRRDRLAHRCPLRGVSGPSLHRRGSSANDPERTCYRLHIEQRKYGISIATGSLELSMILFSPEIFRSNVTSETATPSEHDAVTRALDPSSRNDLIVHF